MAWLAKAKRRNRKTGRKETYWSIQWREEGAARASTRAIGFCSAPEAKKALKVFEGKLAAGQPVVPAGPTTSGRSSSATKRPAIPKLAEYLNGVYLPIVERDRARGTYDVEVNASKALNGLLGSFTLDRIDFALVDAYLSERKDLGRRSRTLILELRTLTGALRHAYDCGIVPAVPKLPRLKDRDRRPHRYLTEAESVALLDALRPLDQQPHRVTRGRPPIRRDRRTYLAVLAALNLGLRKGEILSRAWPDVRWDQGSHGTLIVGAREEIDFQVKARSERAVPLTPELRAELRALHRDLGEPCSGWIFPSPRDPSKPRKDFRKALRSACKRAGVPTVHPHALRHTWASRLAVAGIDRRTLMELGGWKDGRMLDEVYAHVTDDHKADVMARTGVGATTAALTRSEAANDPVEDEMPDSSARQFDSTGTTTKRPPG
jgi:integrase